MIDKMPTLSYRLMKRFKRSLFVCFVLLAAVVCQCGHAPVSAEQQTEQGLLSSIQLLDEQAKTEPHIDQAIPIAKQAVSARRTLAGFYHKRCEFQKIPSLYEDILKRDEQLVHMGAMTEAEIAADYKYIADIYSYLGDDELANKMKVKARAAQPPADVSGKTAASYLDEIKRMRAEGLAALQKGDLAKAQISLEKTLLAVNEKIEPAVQKKMLDHTAGYTLDDWHACLLQQAQLHKDLADVWYKCGDMSKVKSHYEKMVNLKDSGGVSMVDREKDYAYLVALCDADKDENKCILYSICLLKARRSDKSENDPAVLATMDTFAKYLRGIKQNDKAAKLEARAKAVKSGAKAPPLWFSF